MSISNIKPITLNLDGNRQYDPVRAKQLDKGSRFLDVSFTSNKQPYTIPSGTTARVRMLTSRKAEIFNDCTVANNKVTVEFTQNMLADEGEGQCDLVLFNGDRWLSSNTFPVMVEAIPHRSTQITATAEYNSLENALLEVDNLETTYAPRLATLETEVNTSKSSTPTTHNGNVISLPSTAQSAPMNELILYGNTVDGQSVGEVTIDCNGTSTTTPPIGNSVPGIKDTFDVVSGVKTQNVSDTTIINGSLAFINLDISDANNYRMIVLGWGTENNASVSNSILAVSSDGNYEYNSGAFKNTRSLSFYGGNLYVIIEKVKVDAVTGADASAKFKAYLNQYPITLLYQLAQPIITQYDTEVLLSQPNGTIIITPNIKDTKKYTTNITATKPIKSLTKVTKLTTDAQENIIETDIPLSSITIATDKLSFTSTALTSGDMVRFIYEYENGLLPTTKLSYRENLRSVVEGTSKAIAKTSQQVGELNDFTVAYLLNIETRLTAHSI